MDLSEMRKRGEEWIALKLGNTLVHKGRQDESINRISFIIPKEHSNTIILYSNFRRVAYIIYKINNKHNKVNSSLWVLCQAMISRWLRSRKNYNR